MNGAGAVRVGLVSLREYLLCVQRKEGDIRPALHSGHGDHELPSPQKYEQEMAPVQAAQSVIFCLAVSLTKTT